MSKLRMLEGHCRLLPTIQFLQKYELAWSTKSSEHDVNQLVGSKSEQTVETESTESQPLGCLSRGKNR